ncbi:MAG: hypothetical protein NC349_04430 [Paenibacillus sp.]|nr:hypothetical protein [Paenibacillus sp.]
MTAIIMLTAVGFAVGLLSGIALMKIRHRMTRHSHRTVSYGLPESFTPITEALASIPGAISEMVSAEEVNISWPADHGSGKCEYQLSVTSSRGSKGITIGYTSRSADGKLLQQTEFEFPSSISPTEILVTLHRHLDGPLCDAILQKAWEESV